MAAAPGEEPAAVLQERMRSHLSLLRAESAILERVVYKGKNQHRRCPYFKSLLRVRRDLKLLLSAGLDEVFGNLFRIIDPSDPVQRLHALQGLKKKHVGGKHNCHERLLGVTRLLSQMTEPLLVAAAQISALFARSFFMGYSLIILSLLARIRVLIQQILVDSVTVYNEVTSLSQEKHAVKLTHEGVEAYREYHPPCREFLSLKCVWEGDKFVLHEDVDNSRTNMLDNYIEEPSLSETPAILYHVLEVPTVGLQPGGEQVHDNSAVELVKNPPKMKDQLGGSGKVTQTTCLDNEDVDMKGGRSSQDLVREVPLVAKINSSQDMEQPCGHNASSGKVVFVPVRKAASSKTDESRPEKKVRMQSQSVDSPVADESDDPFFRLLTTGSKGKLL